MKPITPELKSKLIQSNAGLKKVKWNEIFDTEEELVMAMNLIIWTIQLKLEIR